MLERDPAEFRKNHKTLAPNTIIAFLLTFALCTILICFSIINRNDVEKLEMEQLIMEKSVKINEVISKLLYKTEALSALVVQGENNIENFDRIAATVVDDPAILNVLIAPGGVVADVYPLAGNEAVLGLDFFGEGAGNKEAIMAKESGSLVFGGPFDLRQGGQALVGRLPVYTGSEKNDENFWGLVSVTLKYPQALDAVGLDVLETQGYAYEIWRTNPDDGERQVIAHNALGSTANQRYIEKHIPLLNADWYFRISPVREWYQYPENWLMVCAGVFISFLIAFVTQNNFELKIMKAEIEHMAQLDHMTGIYNRRYFIENADKHTQKSVRKSLSLFIIIFDLDYFKNINDTYGHEAGDNVIRETTASVKSCIGSDVLFARYGGEEFIMLAGNDSLSAAVEMAERIRIDLATRPFKYRDANIHISASFGVAPYTKDLTLDQATRNADEALYEAKRTGRNRVVSFEDINRSGGC